jgi:hypothetical protein
MAQAGGMWPHNGMTVMNTEQRRYLFCINSGRSGSQYLAELLATAKDVYALHEAIPDMSGPFLNMVRKKGLANTLSARSVKVQAIHEILGELPRRTMYAETNHMFIKTFFDVIMEQLKEDVITVIVLRRYLPAVLKSFINMGYFSKRNKFWSSWMHMPGTCDSAFIPPSLGRNPDQYDLAIGYLIDIEARAQRFIRQYPECEVHEVRLELLQNSPDVERLFEELHLQPTPETIDTVGRPVNERSQRKLEIGIKTTLEYCEQRISEYIGRCQESGINVPLLPQISPSIPGPGRSTAQ